VGGEGAGRMGKEGSREVERRGRVAPPRTGNSVASRKEGRKTREGGIYFEPHNSSGWRRRQSRQHHIASHCRITGRETTHIIKHTLPAQMEHRAREIRVRHLQLGPRAWPRTSRRRRGSCHRRPVCRLVPHEWGVRGQRVGRRGAGSAEDPNPSSVKRASSSLSSGTGRKEKSC
jgi:hypothetical protein